MGVGDTSLREERDDGVEKLDSSVDRKEANVYSVSSLILLLRECVSQVVAISDGEIL